MWKNRIEKEIRKSAIFHFVDKMKYDRRMYEELSDMMQIPILGKVKRRIKTVQHYLIHDDRETAKEQLRQFMDEVEIYLGKKNEIGIYYKDRYTNEIGFYMAMPTRISLDYLEGYMKANNKKFLYITNIEHGKTQAQNQQSWKEYQDQCCKESRKSQKAR